MNDLLDSFNKILSQVYMRVLILISLDLVWKGLEILLDSGIQESHSDTIIGLIFMEVLYRYLFESKEV